MDWTRAEICVIGGGPAGLAAGIALQNAGFSAAVIDCAVPPIDKACGEGLMPEGVGALRQLGVEIAAGVGFPLRGIRFVDRGSSISADFPNETAVGLRRTTLHELLAARAAETGVSLVWDAKGVRLTGDRLSVNGRGIKPRFIVAADGQNSAIRKSAGLNRVRSEIRRYGFRCHFHVSPWSPYVELHWGKQCQIYVTPVSDAEVGIALLSQDPRLRLPAALREFPQLMERLADARPCSNEMGAVTVSRSLRRVSRDGLALIGDASGSVDAITGEGLSLLFRQALALAKALRTGDLSQYERAHHYLARRPRFMGSLLLLAANYDGLRRRAFASFAKHPELFAHLLAIHVGQSSFLRLWSPRLVNFGIDFLAG